MTYTDSDVGSVRFRVQGDKWIGHIHISKGDLLDLVGVSERSGRDGGSVWEYELETPTGQTFTIMDSELESEDTFEELN